MFSDRTVVKFSMLPIGVRLYAIGDVHGEAALLIDMLRLIAADNDGRKAAQVLLVFLGDLIDRGPDGATLVRTFCRLTSDRVVVLKGNHEAGLVEAHGGNEATLEGWLSFGAMETLAGFGITANQTAAGAAELVEAMRAQIEPSLIDWLGNLPTHFQCGDYFLTHAGVRPGVRLDRQKSDDLLWIREPFLSSRKDHGKVIVHGHSIEPGLPRLGSNRIGIDTGGHEHGVLTALGLEGSRQWLLQAKRTFETATGEMIQSTGSEQPNAIPCPADGTVSQIIETLIASIVAADSQHRRPIVPLLELTAAFRSKLPFPQRIGKGSDKRGVGAAAFALILFGLSTVTTIYPRRQSADRPRRTIIVSELPSPSSVAQSSPMPTPAINRGKRKHRLPIQMAHHPNLREPLWADKSSPATFPPQSIDLGDKPSPILHGVELEAALAKDRVITRQLNAHELTRLYGNGDH